MAGDAGAVLARLGEAVGRETVERYLGRSTRLDVDGEGVRVRASSRFAAEMIERRLGAALRAASGSGSVRFEVEAGEAADAGSGGVAGRAAVGGEIAAPARRFNTGANTGAARGGPRSSRGRVRSGDPSQTLGGFVVGGCNRFAFAAISRVAEDEGAVSGPVFLHGPCGVGKTHLLNAAANRFREVRPGGRVRVVTAESFTNEYISAIRSNTIESFHRVYRRVDLLCIDDVHFLATKSGTQQELLHTFDHLCGAGGRIVLASDAHPGTVRQFSEALVSRFVSGSLVKIGAPEAETRRRLVAHFSRAAGLSLTREAAGVLEASAVAGAGTRPVSVRDLAGAVNRLRAFRSVVAAGDGEVGAAEVEAAIRAQGGVVPGRAVSSGSGGGPAAGRSGRPVSVGAVIDCVCETLEVTREDLAGSGRHPRVVLARAGVTWLARRLTRHSYPEIAHAIGRRNHSTVITAYRRIERQIAAGETVGVGLVTDGEPVSVLLERMEGMVRGTA